MRPLFHAFKKHRVQYLIIGGQASILYGAAHFSQDLDLWVEPSENNVRAFIDAMAELGARVHKLTPPLTRTLINRGHGYHFLIPLPGGGVYLDIMGRPPRVRNFKEARRRAVMMPTPWGQLPVASIPDLVELKKTNRPADYDVITRLAMIRIGNEKHPTPRVLQWALNHLFRVEDVLELLQQFGEEMGRSAPPGMGWIRRWRSLLSRGKRPSIRDIDAAARSLGRKASRLQALGRRYWMPRIDELRDLRSRRRLLPEKAQVSRLLLLQKG